ncbi:hypothetical protein [Cellulomonas soli]
MRAFERLPAPGPKLGTDPDGAHPGYVAQVDTTERALLAVLAADVAELLGVGRGQDGLPAWPTDGPEGPGDRAARARQACRPCACGPRRWTRRSTAPCAGCSLTPHVTTRTSRRSSGG